MGTDFQRQARRARLRLAAIGIAVLAAVAGGTIALVTLDDSGSTQATAGDAKSTPSSSSTATAPPVPSQTLTPGSGPKFRLLKPTTTTEGIGRGFEHTLKGAWSASVSYWQDLSLIDDGAAAKQWKAIASKDSPTTVDRGVSEVRKVREAAGLPPSGGSPDGITFSTTVRALTIRGLDTSGNVFQVWMSYDRYAVVRDKGSDQDPKKGETTVLILKWEGNDWRVTDEPQYRDKLTVPQPFHPNSKAAYQDGWREISNG